MIDKLLKLSEDQVVLIFSDRPPITVRTDNQTAVQLSLQLIDWTEYHNFVDRCEERTDPCIILKTA
jgi:hypothetical protein